MISAAIGAIDFPEKQLVAQLRILMMCRRDTDLHVILQNAALYDVPRGDTDEDLDAFVREMKRPDGRVYGGIDQNADQLDSDPAS